MPRRNPPTSKSADVFITPHKPNHKQKIVEGLTQLKVGGTYEEIAKQTGMKESQVWKRMSDLHKDGDVFDTGITRVLSSGCKGIVWQLKSLIKNAQLTLL